MYLVLLHLLISINQSSNHQSFELHVLNIVNGNVFIVVCYPNILKPCLGPVLTINFKTSEKCRLQLKISSRRQTKPNNVSPHSLCSPPHGALKHFCYCEIIKVKQEYFHMKN